MSEEPHGPEFVPGPRNPDVTKLEAENQRLFDLVRYARGYLYDKGLITDDEYSNILTTDSVNSVKRLETYDVMRARIAALEADLAAERQRSAELAAALDEIGDFACWDKTDIDNRAGICAIVDRVQGDIDDLLSSVRAEAKWEGAVEELNDFLLWGPEYRGGEVSVTLTIKEYRDEIRRRIAALKGGA